MSHYKKFKTKELPELAIRIVGEISKNLLSKETIRSAIRGQVRKAITGSREKSFEEVPEVEYFADRTMEIFDQKELSPRNICIDGLPGSGKSTLARYLSRKTGLKWITLYFKDLKERYPFKRNRIYENMRLIRSQNIEFFDVIIYLNSPVELTKSRVLSRDRNGTLIDVLDFDKLKKIGDTAFEMLSGHEINIEEIPVRMKFKPETGYRDMENLRTAIRAENSNFADIERYSKEELLFAYCYGNIRKGIFPYVKWNAYRDEIIKGVSTALNT